MAVGEPAYTAVRDNRAPSSLRLLPWVFVALVLAALLTVYARLRWPGALPLGSDNDEYLLVGEALANFEAPIVAGVEGTKYPLGFPLLLALFDWVGLPPAQSALVTNVAALAVTAGMVAWIAGRSTSRSSQSPAAALAAGAVVVSSAAVWNDVFSVMPEILLLAVVTGALTALSSPMGPRRAAVVCLLAVVAVALKTLALPLFLGGSLAWWLPARAQASTPSTTSTATSRWRSPNVALLPAASAVAMAAIGHVVMLPFPEHTTGYLAVFPLVDPSDASQGRLGVAGMLSRAVSGVPEALQDLGRAIALIDADIGAAALVAVTALALGVIGSFRLGRGVALGSFAAGAVVAYAVAMALWPFSSSRFGLPLTPIAALGVGWVVRAAGEAASGRFSRRSDHDIAPASRHGGGRGIGHGAVEAVVAAGVTMALVATSWPAVAERAEQARATLPAQHEALDVLGTWAQDVPADAVLVSFDYREAARRLDRDVEPISYTSDPKALLAQVEDADFLVVLDFYPKRNARVRALLGAYPERFTEVAPDDNVAVYRIEAID